jgi:hypothetical protein
MAEKELRIENGELRKMDPGSGVEYYEELPEGWKPAMWSDFINRVSELKTGMEYIIHSYHAYDKNEIMNDELEIMNKNKPFMPFQVYKVNEFTTREKLKEWAGRIYVKK